MLLVEFACVRDSLAHATSFVRREDLEAYKSMDAARYYFI